MNKVSQKRRTKATTSALFCDAFGVPFVDAQKWFQGMAVSHWPNRYPMKFYPDPSVCQFMHRQAGEAYLDVNTRNEETFGTCWLCGEQKILTAHHVVSKYDALGNICMCCWSCHAEVQHATDRMPDVLRALWKHNRFVSWVHIIRARGSMFPFDSLD